MDQYNRGSIWRKWDLHVHTPYSIYENFGGDSDDVWEKYINDLENLPKDFKVLGINDYLFVDGYEKVLQYKNSGRLANIELILPVVEFRLNEFAGTEFGKLTRPNIHIIFANEEVLPLSQIKSQFLATLDSKYILEKDGTRFQQTLTKSSLIELGKRIIDSAPQEEKAKYASPEVEGFNNLNLSLNMIETSLKSDCFDGKYLLAIGKTEWDELKWTDASIANKKTLINTPKIIFTAADSIQNYQNAKAKLTQQRVNDLLLDCSDAHSFSDQTSIKDRVGNCFTWIKADTTFEGLKQIIYEPNRIYIGTRPPLLDRVENNKTKYISSLEVNQATEYTGQSGVWFKDIKIPLNNELVAIIGNKGSGKSAIADILGLLGNSKNAGERNKNFSFLNKNKFLKAGYAENFEAVLNWEDQSLPLKRKLSEEVNSNEVEKVRYLPQNYFELLTNSLGEEDFEKTLKSVIFLHIPESDRLGCESFDELEQVLKTNIEKDIEILKSDLLKISQDIIKYEQLQHPDYTLQLQSKINEKEKELASHNEVKPKVVNDPNANTDPISQQTQEKQKSLADLLQFNKELTEVREKIVETRKSLLAAKQKEQKLISIKEEITRFKASIDQFIENNSLNFGDLKLTGEEIIKLSVNLKPIDDKLSANKSTIRIHEKMLDAGLPTEDSLLYKENKLIIKIKTVTDNLSKPEKEYQIYKELHRKWEEKLKTIVGDKTTPEIGSLNYYKKHYSWITEQLDNKLLELRDARLDKSIEIYKKKIEILSLYNKFKKAVDKQIEGTDKLLNKFKIEISSNFVLENEFPKRFLNYINKTKSGTFRAANEQKVYELFQDVNLSDDQSIRDLLKTFLICLEEDQSEDIEVSKKKRYISDQVSDLQAFYDYIFSLEYLIPVYTLQLDGKKLSELSPGERGALLLVFYLMIDKEEIPLIIDQPEDNLDNKSVFEILTHFIKLAKERRQIIIVTHNPNLAVVADAEQIIYVTLKKNDSYQFSFESGSIENPKITNRLIEILEGTMPAFKNRELKYIRS